MPKIRTSKKCLRSFFSSTPGFVSEDKKLGEISAPRRSGSVSKRIQMKVLNKGRRRKLLMLMRNSHPHRPIWRGREKLVKKFPFSFPLAQTQSVCSGVALSPPCPFKNGLVSPPSRHLLLLPRNDAKNVRKSFPSRAPSAINLTRVFLGVKNGLCNGPAGGRFPLKKSWLIEL